MSFDLWVNGTAEVLCGPGFGGKAGAVGGAFVFLQAFGGEGKIHGGD
jgi:hypothetical protein